jgi:hypothetical protein
MQIFLPSGHDGEGGCGGESWLEVFYSGDCHGIFCERRCVGCIADEADHEWDAVHDGGEDDADDGRWLSRRAAAQHYFREMLGPKMAREVIR